MSAQSANRALRSLWFQVHLWIGVGLSLVLIPISVTGALLVWHEPLERVLTPQRYAVTGEATRPLQDYAEAARTVLGTDEPIAQIRLPEHHGGPVLVSAPMSFEGKEKPKGRPPQHNVWVDPGAARVLDQASSSAGAARFMHQLHGTLLIPDIGRKVVGWLGWLMLTSCLTGIWIWWPRNGAFLKGLKWNRSPLFTGKLHHVVGFWIAIPLAVLSFSGAYISFPQTMKTVAGVFGGEKAGGGERGGQGRGEGRGKAEGRGEGRGKSEGRGRGEGRGKGEGRPRDGGPPPRPRPLAATAMTPDQAIDAAAALRPAGGLPLYQVAWPTVKKAEWVITWRKGERTVEATVDDATGAAAVKPQDPQRSGVARLMRRIHDGTGLGWFWQTIIFLGGMAPAVLGVTGVWMWLRQRGGRRAVESARALAGGK